MINKFNIMPLNNNYKVILKKINTLLQLKMDNLQEQIMNKGKIKIKINIYNIIIFFIVK